jgi:putative FmdB family regulatory protein
VPIYGFKCPEHGETERRLPIAECGQEQRCDCGKLMVRIYSPVALRVKQKASDIVRDTLNREHSKTRPTRETMLLASGLED